MDPTRTKALTPILATVVAVLIALTTIPGMHARAHALLGVFALAVSILVLVSLFWHHRKPEEASAAAGPAQPVPADVSGSAEAEVIAFLGLLQEKGRLIDFLMDDISQHDDAAVGAVARVVYQGCRAVIDDQLEIVPLADGAEGSSITVPQGYRAADYQLSGKLTGEAPFTGTLVHKGWKVNSIKLPKVLAADADDSSVLPPLAPAQVEIA